MSGANETQNLMEAQRRMGEQVGDLLLKTRIMAIVGTLIKFITAIICFVLVGKFKDKGSDRPLFDSFLAFGILSMLESLLGIYNSLQSVRDQVASAVLGTAGITKMYEGLMMCGSFGAAIACSVILWDKKSNVNDGATKDIASGFLIAYWSISGVMLVVACFMGSSATYMFSTAANR